MKGRIEAVCISENKGEPKVRIGGALFKEDYGIIGDAHAGTGRQISLLSMAAVDRILDSGHYVQPGDFAENLLVSGIDFGQVRIGMRIKISGVILQITQIGKECHDKCAVHKRLGLCVMPKEGVFARVIKGGVIREGDAVEVCCIVNKDLNEGSVK
jgi:MOSC domain-containing protein YiiM